MTIRLKGRGGPGRNGGPAGDLLVECNVTPHRLFTRDGANLMLRVPITYPEAVLGAEIEVPTLLGDNVKLRLRPGTQPGSKHRVKGQGHRHGEGDGRFDRYRRRGCSRQSDARGNRRDGSVARCDLHRPPQGPGRFLMASLSDRFDDGLVAVP